MILTIRTDTAEARLALYGPRAKDPAQAQTFELGRNMARDLPSQIEALLHGASISWENLTGIVVFQGPGSFTGLRIGATVANTIAYAQKIPIVGEVGEAWASHGITRLQKGEDDKIVLPFYGREAQITQPRK